MRCDARKAYVLYNGHGDVTEIRDENGELLNQYSYDIWGNLLTKNEQVHNPFLYSGQLWDDATKLQYLRARWYDPSVGRFISKDSYEGEINNPLSLNLYTYVHNNPFKYVDPSGHIPSALEAAYMAKNIYEVTDADKGGSPLEGGWILERIKTNDEGLKIGVYTRFSYGVIEYALVNKGTETLGDWGDNFQQPFGYSTDMKDSIEFAKWFVDGQAGFEVTMVGHSKGGAESMANAVATNTNGIAFNPSLPSLFFNGILRDYFSYDKKITSYMVKGDMLTSVVGRSTIAEPIYLPDQNKIKWNDSALTRIAKAYKNHSMDSVIKALKERFK